MDFERKKAIYLQIADYVCEQILIKNWKEKEKIPSIRELAINIEVNPNTVMRTYTYLEEKRIIEMQRGIGYFVTDNAFNLIIENKRHHFLNQDLPQVFKLMDLLEINVEHILEKYRERDSNEKE